MRLLYLRVLKWNLSGGHGTSAPPLDDPLPTFIVLRGHPGRPCSPHNLAFAFLTDSSTNAALGNTAKHTELYNYVQAFQVRLGRSI
jgi:hypothetical protein